MAEVEVVILQCAPFWCLDGLGAERIYNTTRPESSTTFPALPCTPLRVSSLCPFPSHLAPLASHDTPPSPPLSNPQNNPP